MDSGKITLSLVFVFIWGLSDAQFFTEDHIKRLNFVAQNVGHGRKAIRVAYGGILVIDSMSDALDERGLFIREVSNGKQVVKLVYEGSDNLVTCDLIKDDPEMMLQFLSHFLSKQPGHQKDLKQERIEKHLGRHGNFTWEEVTEQYMLSHPQYLRMTDLKTLKAECKDFITAQKQAMEDMRASPSEKDSTSKQRQKRASALIYPGTKWCGKGSAGQNYEDLGERRSTDKCCRSHDMCPYYIETGKKSYGYYNYGISTMVHCQCDERFRTCLKFQKNRVADNLGDIFFNRLAAKCFVFRPVRVCIKKSFWGRCTEYKTDYKAQALEALEY